MRAAGTKTWGVGDRDESECSEAKDDFQQPARRPQKPVGTRIRGSSGGVAAGQDQPIVTRTLSQAVLVAVTLAQRTNEVGSGKGAPLPKLPFLQPGGFSPEAPGLA